MARALAKRLHRMERFEDVLQFWFGNRAGTERYFQERMALWFGGAPLTDMTIRKAFGRDVEQAEQGELEHWQDTPEGCLALIILLDQFSLNIYRDEPRSFQNSAMAVPLALKAIERGWDKQVHWTERPFFYLPLEHAEDLSLQKMCVELAREMVQDSPVHARESMEGFHHYAVLHLEVIERFGRFPDRNSVYGRPSTPEEQMYLDQGGPPF
jgi:uncharacterized protein (DUF924 family)